MSCFDLQLKHDESKSERQIANDGWVQLEVK